MHNTQRRLLRLAAAAGLLASSISTLAIGPSAWASGGAPQPQNGNHYRTCDDFRVLQNYLRARGDPPSDYVNNRVSACAD